MSFIIRISDLKRILISILMVLTVHVIQTYMSTYILLPIIIGASLYLQYTKASKYQIYIAIIVIIINNPKLGYTFASLLSCYALIAHLQSKKMKTDALGMIFTSFLALGVCSFIISQAVESNLLSLPLFTITFFSLMGVFFFYRSISIDINEKKRFFEFIIITAIVESLVAYFSYVQGVGFIQILTYESTPDEVTGTLGYAHTFGFFLFASALLATAKFLQSKKKIWIVIIPYLFFFGVLTDTKTYLIGIILPSIFLIVRWLWVKSGVTGKWILILGFGLFLYWSVPRTIKAMTPIANLMYSLYVEGRYNHKYIYISRTLDYTNRNLVQYLIGTGPGTCGSRPAISRSYDSILKYHNKFVFAILPPKTSIYTHNFLVDLYQYNYKVTSPDRSAILGDPFNSWTAIYIEFGLIGFVLLCSFFGILIYKLWCKKLLESKVALVLLIAIIIGGCVELTFEGSTAMIFTYLLCGLILSEKK